MNASLKILNLSILFLLFSFPGHVFSEEPQKSPEEIEVELQENITRQLNVIKDAITSANKELAQVEAQLSKAKKEITKKKLTEKRDKLILKIDGLYLKFEAAVTGGVRISDYEKKEEKKPFDWQSEVLEIFKPMIAELKQMTERLRAIEELKGEIAAIEEHIPVAQKAIEQIQLAEQAAQDPLIQKQLVKVEKEWLARQDELNNQLKLLTFQLEEKLNPPEDTLSVGDKLIAFFTGRGLTIGLALGAFILFFFLFAFLGKVVEKRITRKPEKQKQFFRRALRIVLQFLAILFSLFAAMLVLYVRDDWLILGFILIILIGFAWGLRTSAPKYVQEIKLLLNMGPVREGERVIYNDLPWRVASLNMYTTLTNPVLAGGTIKLPLVDIVELRSREFSPEESWFPCNPDDYVMLDDGSYGEVIRQTPEVVQMSVLGGSTKTYGTTNFLSLNPRNLSHGFGIFVTFGLDYDLQSDMPETIPQQLEATLKEILNSSSYGQHLNYFAVEFKAASSSSLDVVIVSTFNGEAAGDYFGINRFLQRETVKICSDNSWSIPFDNVTVHLGKP